MSFVAAIILLPSYVIVEKNRSALEASGAASDTPSANKSDQDLLNHIKSRVGELGPLVSATSTPNDLITAALALRPVGITIDHIGYSIGKTATILLTGSSKAGDQVNAYQRSLASSNAFAGVSVPVGALAGVNDGRFSITIVAK